MAGCGVGHVSLARDAYAASATVRQLFVLNGVESGGEIDGRRIRSPLASRRRWCVGRVIGYVG